MKKLFRYLDKIEEYSLTVLMLAMTILIVTQVVSRTVFKNSLAFTEELARYILVWITFIGASLGIKRGAHIGVEAFTMLFPDQVKKVVKYIMLVLCVVFTFLVFKESTAILKMQILTNQVSAAVQLPMWIPYLGVTLGSLLMTFRFIESILTVNTDDKVRSEC